MLQHRKHLIWTLPLLLLVFLCSAAYLYFPEILQNGLQRWLTQQGYSNVTLQIERPSWNKFVIHKLELVKEDDNQRISIQSNQISLRFDPYKATAHQPVQFIELPDTQITVQYKDNNSTSSSNDEFIDLSPLLPKKWLSQLPAEQLRIGEMTLKLDYPESIPDWTFRGSLQADKQQLTSRIKLFRNNEDLGWADMEVRADNHFHLRLLKHDSPFIIIDGALSFTDKLQLESTQLFNLSDTQHWLNQLLSSNDVISQIPLIKAGSISLTGQTIFPLKTQLSPDNLLRSLQTEQSISGNIQLDNPLPSIGTLKTELKGSLKFQEHKLQTTLNSSSLFNLDHLQIKGLSSPINSAQINLTSPLQLNVDTGSLLSASQLPVTIQPITATITMSDIQYQEHRIQTSPIKVELTKIKLTPLEVNAIIHPATFSTENNSLPTVTLSSKINLHKSTLSTQFKANSTLPSLSLQGKSSTDLNKNRSDISWKLQPAPLANIENSLSAYIQIPAELSIHKGTLFHNGSARLRNGKLNTQLYNSIQQADLSWDQAEILGVNWNSATAISPQGNIRDKGSIKVNSFIQGVDINKISSEYQFKQQGTQQTLQVSEVQASLLEGQVNLSPFVFDLHQPSFDAEVTLTNLDLGALLSLEQQQGLSGEGKLSGSFPATYKNGALSIADGGLKALDPGGKIRFQPNAAVATYAAGNSGLKMALNALENFHYEQLEVKLDYAPDGTAYLQTHLKGKNPDWNNGQRMDFNINIEENIPQLLKTLQFTDKLTETIEKRYR